MGGEEVVSGGGDDGGGVREEVAEDEVAEFAGEEEDGEGHWDCAGCVLVRVVARLIVRIGREDAVLFD